MDKKNILSERREGKERGKTKISSNRIYLFQEGKECNCRTAAINCSKKVKVLGWEFSSILVSQDIKGGGPFPQGCVICPVIGWQNLAVAVAHSDTQ